MHFFHSVLKSPKVFGESFSESKRCFFSYSHVFDDRDYKRSTFEKKGWIISFIDGAMRGSMATSKKFVKFHRFLLISVPFRSRRINSFFVFLLPNFPQLSQGLLKAKHSSAIYDYLAKLLHNGFLSCPLVTSFYFHKCRRDIAWLAWKR